MKSEVVEVDGYKIMTYSEGDSDQTLLLIHGGPGCPCNYLRDAHLHFAESGYRVVTWDQLGGGESERATDRNLFQLSRFVEEVEAVRVALKLGKVHLLGQSWGGVLGLEYCFKYIQNVKTFIAVSTAFDLPRMQRGFERKKLALGEQVYTMMAAREAEGTTDHPEYQAAITLLRYRHFCRLDQWPESLEYSMKNIATPVFSTMFGPYFFNCTGNIRGFNRMDDLSEIEIPVFIVHGEHDYIIPELACIARDNFPNAELMMIRGGSHTSFIEKPQQYTEGVLSFLSKHNGC